MENIGHDPAVSIAVAMAVGVIAQSLARHLRIPGIVLLLFAGVLLGPDLAGVVQPDSIGGALHTIVGFAVAVILFEGGMNLQVGRLRKEQVTIRRLVTIGALVTTLGGALAARYILGWSWRMSFLFGTLVIVTGPTVITPILRRIRVKRSLHTVLEAEGVLIDAVGALIAVFALELAISPTAHSLAEGSLGFLYRLGIGSALGAVGGGIVAFLLRYPKIVPEGLENIFSLSMALAVFQVSNAFLAESGLAAVIVAGMIVGNAGTRVQRDLLEFKEQLTILLIGMLFVLLAADVRVADVERLGLPGILTVLTVMFVVRPINVAVCTFRAGLPFRDRAFLSWLAPRGIVAAAIASLFVETLERNHVAGGPELRALVFLVITLTVVVQGLSSGFVAKLLGVRKRTGTGYAILAAHPLARALGRALRDAGEVVVFLDANPDQSHNAEEDGFKVIFGNALEERTLQRAEIDRFADAIALTLNEGVNLLFCQTLREEYRVPRVHVAIGKGQASVTPDLVHDAGGTVLFGPTVDVELWAVRYRRDFVDDQRWRLETPPEKKDRIDIPASLAGAVLPLVLRRGKRVALVDELTKIEKNDEVDFAVFKEQGEHVETWLSEQGWVRTVEEIPEEPISPEAPEDARR